MAGLRSLPCLAFLASLSFSSLASLPLAAGAVVAAGGSGQSSRPSLKPTTISARRFLPALCSSQSSSQIGRASCRDRVFPYLSISVVVVSCTQKKHTSTYHIIFPYRTYHP